MRVLTGEQLSHLVPAQALIAAVERALHALSQRLVVIPDRQHIDWNRGTLLLMPAIGPEMIGMKLVSVVPGNAATQKPVTSGLMMLLDARTGQRAALLDAAMLTARRTGAVGALSLKLMTPSALDSVGVVGIGVQGAWQAICACAVRPIQTIYYVARSAASEERFVRLVRNHVTVRLTRCTDVRALLRCTSAVMTATTSSVPVLPDEPNLLAGKHFVSVGSFKPVMQELPHAVFRLAGKLVIDSDAARQEVGDVINPIRDGVLADSDLIHLADLLAGRREVDVNQTTVFKSVGLALYDLYVAQAMLQAAHDQGVGHELDL
jgi:ornithine cyclodeaminase/alanine dehydrogenase-like protein (mu-crystallin family)